MGFHIQTCIRKGHPVYHFRSGCQLLFLHCFQLADIKIIQDTSNFWHFAYAWKVNYPESKESKLVTHLYGPNVITR